MTSLTKSSPKELAYRKGRKDERAKLVNNLYSLLNVLIDETDATDKIQIAVMVLMSEKIRYIIKTLENKPL